MGRTKTWEWLLSDGVTVRASLDRRRDIESVWIGPRLVSRAPCGGKPEGHVISLSPYRSQEARVSFDAGTETCTLWVGAEQIEPRATSAEKRAIPSRAMIAIVACGAALVVAGASVAAVRIGRTPAPVVIDNGSQQWSVSVAAHAGPPIAPEERTLRAPNGLLVAHFPAGFVAKPERADKDDWTAVTITRASGGDDAITLRSVASASKDEEDFTSSLLAAAVEDMERAGMRFEETSRKEGACLGGTATISEGSVQRGGRRLQTWSCAFVHAGHGFVLGYRTSDDASSPDLRAILDATVLAAAPKEPPRAQDVRPNVVPAPAVVVGPYYYGHPYYPAYVAHYGVVAPVVATTRPTTSTMIVHAAPSGGQSAIDIDVLCDERGACQKRTPPRKR